MSPIRYIYTPTWLFWYISGMAVLITVTLWIILPFHSIGSGLLWLAVLGITFYFYRRAVTHRYGPDTQPKPEQHGITVWPGARIKVTGDELNRIKTKMMTGVVEDDNDPTLIMHADHRQRIYLQLVVIKIVILTTIFTGLTAWGWMSFDSLSSAEARQIRHYLVLVPIGILYFGSIKLVMAWVRWSSWCIVVTDSRLIIYLFYPPEIVWTNDKNDSVPIDEIGKMGAEVPWWGKWLKPHCGYLGIDTASQDDKMFNSIHGVQDPEYVDALIASQRKKLRA